MSVLWDQEPLGDRDCTFIIPASPQHTAGVGSNYTETWTQANMGDALLPMPWGHSPDWVYRAPGSQVPMHSAKSRHLENYY